MNQLKTALANVYDNLSTEELAAVYAAGASRVRKVLEGLTETELAAHPRPGKWSIKEIVIHLTDAEVIGASRVRQCFAEPESTFAFYNQDVWAAALDYQNHNFAALTEALALFDALRLTTARIFDRATAADWRKFGLHPERRMLTLRQLLELYADHSERHVEQILHVRELLGKPLELPLLLPIRLY